jgi:dienelactone hydrolase
MFVVFPTVGFSVETARAALPIDKKAVTIGQLKCDGIQTGAIYYPADASKKYPLLSFAHGWTEGGTAVETNYKDVLETVAAAGYVVVAEESGAVLLCYGAEEHDQIRAIDFVKETAEFANRVDWDQQIGLYGHSMGGAASGLNAANADVVNKYNVAAAVALHPAQGGQQAKTTVPTFFATGSIDTIVPPGGVKAMYNLATGPKVYAELKGAGHFECQSYEPPALYPKHRWTPYVVDWFDCYVKKDQASCAAALKVCDDLPMTACEHKPASDVSVETDVKAVAEAAPSGSYCGKVPVILEDKLTINGDGTADFNIDIKIAKQVVDCHGEKITMTDSSIHFTEIASDGDCMGDALRGQGKDPTKYFMDINSDGSLTFHSDGYPNLKMKTC